MKKYDKYIKRLKISSIILIILKKIKIENIEINLNAKLTEVVLK